MRYNLQSLPPPLPPISSLAESPLLWDGPHNVTAATGSTVMLRCRFNGIPTPSIYWYHEGKEVTSGDRVSLSAKDGVASLHILCLEPSLAGEYMCTAVNSVGTATTEAVITAQGEPVVLIWYLLY